MTVTISNIEAPGITGEIISVNCYINGINIDHFSNFNGDFEPIDLEHFCEDLAQKGEYDNIVISYSSVD